MASQHHRPEPRYLFGVKDPSVDRLFTPWYDDPREIAKLWRWLVSLEQTPSDVAGFIENPEPWLAQYQAMCDWTGDAA